MNIVEIIIAIGMISYLIYAIYSLNIAKKDYSKVNQNDFDLIPSMFTTIGILGTFAGIAYGLSFFNEKDIEKSIPPLLTGLKTAFFASIFGILLSIIFSKRISFLRNKNEKGVLSDETQAINKLIDAINDLRNDLSSIDDNGNKIKAGNILRDIYKESVKQSNSLQSFSTDLALTVSAGFEEILNNPTNAIVSELKLVKEEIESLGSKLKDPTTEMTQSIVKELQSSIGKMIEEFKVSMSGDTKNEMERLAMLLGNAGTALTDFPIKLQNMTDNLNENFRGLQAIVQNISENTLSQSNQSITDMRNQIEEMSKILTTNVGDLQVGQETLINKQTENIEISDNLLNSFNLSIDKMNTLSIEVTQSINKLTQAQNELNLASASFRNISQDVNVSASKFGESQVAFSKHSNEFLENNNNIILEIIDALSLTKEVSTEYADKFEIIESGLSSIFKQIQLGLDQYQNTVRDSVQKYLNDYTNQLTNTTQALEGIASKLDETMEELTDELSKQNQRRN